MVYVDELLHHGWKPSWNKYQPIKNCHLFSGENDKNEVLAFALKIGMKAQWLQKASNGIWHFDLTEKRRSDAIDNSAIPLTSKEAVTMWQTIRKSIAEANTELQSQPSQSQATSSLE